MKNAMQLKAVIKNISKDKHISAQLVMQNFMLGAFAGTNLCFKYHRNFILKGWLPDSGNGGFRLPCYYGIWSNN